MTTAMVLMGTVGFFVVESNQHPINVVFFRSIIGAGCLAVYCYLTGHFKNNNLNLRTLLLLSISGILLVYNLVLFFAAYKVTSISITTAVYHTQPLFLLIINAIVFRESVGKKQMMWVAVAFVGVMLVANINNQNFAITSQYIKGIIYALVAAVMWAIVAIIVKQLKDIKPHIILLTQITIGTIALFPIANFNEIAKANNIEWTYLIILGAVHTGIVYMLIYSAIQKIKTENVAVLAFIYPVIAVGLDIIVYQQWMTIAQTIGAVMIISSSLAITKQNLINNNTKNNKKFTI